MGLGLALLLAGCAVAAARPCVAQSLWIPRSTPSGLSIEVFRPDFDGVSEQVISVAAFVDYRKAVRNGSSLVLELPAARFGATPVHAFSVGNAYVGMEQQFGGSPLFLELGVRLPFLKIHELESDVTGEVSDVNRWEAFRGSGTSFLLALNARHLSPSGLMLRARAGPALTLNSGYGSIDTEVMAIYSVQAGLERPSLRAGGGISARTLLTGGISGFSERTETQADLHADFGSGMLRPGVEVKAPLDDLRHVAPIVLGVSLGVWFPE